MVDPEANLIFGAVVDPSLAETGEVSITIIATGIRQAEKEIGALSQSR